MDSSSSLNQASHVTPQLSKKGGDFGGAWEILSDLEVQHLRENGKSSDSYFYKFPG